ncbi:MAG: hypothetical protein WKG01_37595 [Kofleriaceae bacterium]
MSEKAEDTTTWDDLRRVADELKLKMHLAGMEAREQWEKLQPKLAELEHSVEAGAAKAGHAISEQVASLGSSLKKLLADIKGGDHKDGDKPEEPGKPA